MWNGAIGLLLFPPYTSPPDHLACGPNSNKYHIFTLAPGSYRRPDDADMLKVIADHRRFPQAGRDPVAERRMAQLFSILGLPDIGTVRCARPRTTDVRVASGMTPPRMNVGIKH